MIAAIVAMAHNNVIGKKNELPWYLPADLKRFRELTVGHTVVMGRNTADSILARNGKPLPNRKNIVITRDTTYQPEGFTVVHSVEEALQAAGNNAFILGGAQIYKAALPFIHRLYITEVDAHIDGDAFFPPIAPNEWREVERDAHEADEKNQFAYTYLTLERIAAAQ